MRSVMLKTAMLGAAFLLASGTARAAVLEVDVPFPFSTAAEMLDMAQKSGLSIAQMKSANERVHRSEADIDAGLDAIWQTMHGCIDRGLREHGTLPGGLKVRRRAPELDPLVEDEGGRHLVVGQALEQQRAAVEAQERRHAGG